MSDASPRKYEPIAVSAESTVVAEYIPDAHASAAFLRHNVGQTVRDQTSGNFVLVPKPEHLSRETAPPPPSDVNP